MTTPLLKTHLTGFLSRFSKRSLHLKKKTHVKIELIETKEWNKITDSCITCVFFIILTPLVPVGYVVFLTASTVWYRCAEPKKPRRLEVYHFWALHSQFSFRPFDFCQILLNGDTDSKSISLFWWVWTLLGLQCESFLYSLGVTESDLCVLTAVKAIYI